MRNAVLIGFLLSLAAEGLAQPRTPPKALQQLLDTPDGQVILVARSHGLLSSRNGNWPACAPRP